MKGRLKSRLTDALCGSSGAVLIIVGLALTAMLGFSALVLDMGVMYVEKSELQNALDSAALAGAQNLPDEAAAKDAAEEYFEDNGYSMENVFVTFGTSEHSTVTDLITCTSTAYVQTSMGRLFGADTLSTSELHATAMHAKHEIKSPFDYALFQGEPGRELRMGGSPFTITGSVFSNGTFISHPSTKSPSIISGVETVSNRTLDIGASTKIGAVSLGVEPIGMVDMQDYFSEKRDFALSGGFSNATSTQINTWSYNVNNSAATISGNVTINQNFAPNRHIIIEDVLHVKGNMNASAGIEVLPGGALIVDGNLTWGGSYNSHFYDALIYCGGDISAYPGGKSYFHGATLIYTYGNTNIGGSGFLTENYTKTVNGVQKTISPACFFYSQTGNMDISPNSSNYDVHALFYVYKGSFRLSSSPHIYGGVIANRLTDYAASMTITYNETVTDFSMSEEYLKLVD